MRTCAIAIVVLTTACGSASAGSLTPPVGVPAPTMKTLDQIEPRIPIGPLTTPGDGQAMYAISAPGSYYLTADTVGVAGKHGVRIDANDVTIDLAGFTLRGVAGSLDGVTTSGWATNLTVRNGAVRNWGDDGVDLGMSYSITIEGVRSLQNGDDGFVSNTSMVYRGCQAISNGDNGFLVGFQGVVTDCLATSNGGHGFAAGTGVRFDGVGAASNGKTGLTAPDHTTIIASRFTGNNNEGAVVGMRSIVRDSEFLSNGSHGLRPGSQSLVQNNFLSANAPSTGGAGLFVTLGTSAVRIEGNTLVGNGWGLLIQGVDNLATRNFASMNTNANYSVVAGNTAGPVVGSASVLTSTNPNANYTD